MTLRAKKYILVGIIATIIAVTCYIIYQVIRRQQALSLDQSQQTTNRTILEVQFQVSAPFSVATLLVTNQGSINYEASAPRAGIDLQTDSTNITAQQFNDLAALIIENDFWSFKEQYSDENIQDATTYSVSVKSTEAGIYSVSCYGDCPDQIVEIIDKIEELWGKEILEVGV